MTELEIPTENAKSIASNERYNEAYARLDSALKRYYNIAKGAEAPAKKEEDDSTHGAYQLIEPNYDPLILTRYLESASELGQIIAAMVANTAGYGFMIVNRDQNQSKDDEPPELKAERLKLLNFFEYVNPRQNLIAVLEEGLWDYYLTGNMYFEITRNPVTRQPDGLYRLPSHQMRATRQEREVQRIEFKQVNVTDNGHEIVTKEEAVRFRRYAQVTSNSFAGHDDGYRVWFKEFQDPRNYNRDTGELVTDRAELTKLRAANKLANECIHIAAPAKRNMYGLPAHIGNIISINGDIAAENINAATFTNNNIPSMVISVSGGQLTPGSIDRLTDFIESKIQGDPNRSKFLLLESETPDLDDLDSGRSKIDIKPLTSVQHNDAMFVNYSSECRAAIRRAFRLPEVLVGRGEARSGALVAAAVKLSDEQVFSQDRRRFVDWINRRLLPELGVSSLKLELNSPNATDPATLVNLLATGEKTGAMTPEIGRLIFEAIFGRELPEFPAEFDATRPFSLTMAEAVKKINDSGANNPTGSQESEQTMNGADQTEPSQQFTADRASSE